MLAAAPNSILVLNYFLIMDASSIVELLPYREPFLFVDELTALSESGVKGHYRFREDAVFYPGHFPGNPITPGVLLIECMAQIGLVALGIFLMHEKLGKVPELAFTSSNVEFYKMVLPGEQVFVESKKLFFRLGKLKAAVEMRNADGELVAKGELSGMMLRNPKT